MGIASIVNESGRRRRKVQFECVSSIYRRDSISSLPDDILGKILSSLPTKLAASTSVLSKRWRNLLPLVDSLDFDDSVFLYPERDRHQASGFSEFLDMTVALLSKCPIKSLSVNVNGRYEKCRLDGWIRTAVQQRSLSELHLRCNHRIDRDTEFLFFSKTLVKLTLSGGCSIEFVPEDVAVFPALKSLSLGHVLIEAEDYDKLISLCPVLEELFIHNGEDDPQPSWTGNVPGVDSLKRLVIYYHAPKYRELYKNMVYLRPKNLVYLDYSGYVSSYYVIVSMPSLVEARLDLRLLDSTIHFDDAYDHIFGNTTRLLGFLSFSVRTLHLSSDSLEAIHFCCERFLVFKHLHTLSFESYKDKGWQVLPRLLRVAPNLQTLVIKGLVHRATRSCGDVCPCILKRHRARKGVTCGCTSCLFPQELPKVSCLANLPVKVLEISGYGGTSKGTCREFKQMLHFLKNLKSLQLVKIRIQPDADSDFLRLRLRVLTLHYNKSCNIHFI